MNLLNRLFRVPRTTDQIISSFSDTIQALVDRADQCKCDARNAQAAIDEAWERRLAADEEALRAQAIADKLHALISGDD